MLQTPATIAETFDAWNALQTQVPGADQETLNRLCDEQAQIEDLAIGLPVTSVHDLWKLLAIVTDPSDALRPAAEALFRRARSEAATTTTDDRNRTATGPDPDAEAERLRLLKATRCASGLSLDFWADVTENLPDCCVTLLCGKALIFSKYISSTGKP